MAPVRLPTPSSLRPSLLVVLVPLASSSPPPQALVLLLPIQQVCMLSMASGLCMPNLAVLISYNPSTLWFHANHIQLYCLHFILLAC